ncbi:MAG: four helix bundle protein [Sedimentisphaerales bacterium]|jgi:four helix bundle protein
MGIKTFRDLTIWQKSIELVIEIYSVIKEFPKEETYGLVSQMRRAAVSIPSNTAEGFRRFHNKEYKQFLYVSAGSCGELETQITIARKLDYIDEEQESVLLEKLDHIGRMISSLIKKL